jgi:molybdopterin converting factor subunit 1
MNKITILFFATLKEKVGANRAELELPENQPVAELKRVLAEKYPAIQPIIGNTLISINQQFAFDEDLIPSGAEIALFPPVSGGSDYPTIYKVVSDILDLNDIVKQITLPTTGAVCIFTGIVRGETNRGDPHITSSLEYEAYVPMAEGKMVQVADEIRQRWPSVEGIAIVQRIGHLDPGTPTVLIACSAAHRDTGVFEAARYGIDRLKEIVPVWKKEVGPQGETWVEGEYFPRPGE